MIPIKKSLRNKPISLTSASCNKSLESIWNNGNPNKAKISDHYYRAPDVVKKLAGLYHNKCAYCESFDNEFEVEHYRPKAGLTEDSTHLGYYWLCYEWTNLLPACHDCNKTRNKGNRFPILGNRAFSPTLITGTSKIDLKENNFLSTALSNEQALLLHPEHPSFDPFRYFYFNKNGVMFPKPNKNTIEYQQAIATINEVVKLNRDSLYLNYRKESIQDLMRLIQLHLVLLQGKEMTIIGFKKFYFNELMKIKEKSHPHKKFSFFWSYLYINFGKYINWYFNTNNRVVLHLLNQEFKNKN